MSISDYDHVATIYVTTGLPQEFLCRQLADCLRAQANTFGHVMNDTLRLNVVVNTEPDVFADFGGSAYYIEICAGPQVKTEEQAITALAFLLACLWNLGVGTVTASDYEESLPDKGRRPPRHLTA